MRDSNKSDAANVIFWRDEILQVMYWLAGEQLAKECSLDDLKRFLPVDKTVLTQTVAAMVYGGLLDEVGDQRYILTAQGHAEGARRFADEFDNMLKPGHFECDLPDCDCHNSDSLNEPCRNLHFTQTVAEGRLN